MNFFKKSKEVYCEIDNESKKICCHYCNKFRSEKNIKECFECKKKVICRECYRKRGKIICRECQELYNVWVNKLKDYNNKLRTLN